jgi:sortase A
VAKEDLLERQLEKLFSDFELPEPTTKSGRQQRPAAAMTLQPGTASSVVVLRTPAERRVFKPQWLPGLNWVLGLAVLVTIVTLGFFLIKQESLTRAATRITPPTIPAVALVQQTTPSPTPSRPPKRTEAFSVTQTRQATPTATASLPTPASWPVTLTVSVAGPSPTVVPVFPLPTDNPTQLAPAFTAIPTATTVSEVQATLTPTLKPINTPTNVAEITATLLPSPTASAREVLSSLQTPTPTKAQPEQGLPSRLVIPAINLEAPIVTVGFVNYVVDGQKATTWSVPNYFAVGWHHTSAPPGQPGNTVLNGHQFIYGGVFRNLSMLQQNDEIIVRAGDTEHHYRVAEQHIVEEEGQPLAVRANNARWIMPTGDERLTLITCAPDGSSTHRLIIVAFPVDQAPPAIPEGQ